MKNYIRNNITIAVVGLGYVGLPIAVSFAEKGIQTIAYDNNCSKIELYNQCIDPTNEIGSERLKQLLLTPADDNRLIFTSEQSELAKANFYIVTVPTPVNQDNTPNLMPVLTASDSVGQVLKAGDIVVYESTVYPGVTEELCLPVLEKISGLVCGKDFKIGYSPERINPADNQHKIHNITKVVSGMDEDSLEKIAEVYEVVVEAGIYKAESIKVAEAAKVIENSQRDINIAFMNELSIIFDKMGIDTQAVLKAASTKWNFLNFTPGLVGGHCIGVDPYYLTYKAQLMGYSPEVILAGRNINDQMGKHIAEKTVKKMIEADIPIKGSKVGILGLTFKENCGDLRNSKVADIIDELREYGVETIVTDCEADRDQAIAEYDVKLIELSQMADLDAVIVAVAHDCYKSLTLQQLAGMCRGKMASNRVLIDVKGIFDRQKAQNEFLYWRL